MKSVTWEIPTPGNVHNDRSGAFAQGESGPRKTASPIKPGGGRSGSLQNLTEEPTLFSPAYEGLLALTALARQTAPTILPIVWNIFR